MKSNVCDGKNPKFSGMCLTDFGMLCALLGPEFEGALVNGLQATRWLLQPPADRLKMEVLIQTKLGVYL